MGKKGEETRALIREKALLLFAQKGFDGVTMKDICLATGLSRGGLYRHYESTRQIFSEILELMLDAQRQEFSEKMRGGIAARDILSGILERYRNEMLDGSGALSLAILEFYRQRRPGGGENGGRILAAGTPEAIMAVIFVV